MSAACYLEFPVLEPSLEPVARNPKLAQILHCSHSGCNLGVAEEPNRRFMPSNLPMIRNIPKFP